MSTIIKYLLDMIPYILFATPIYLVARFIILKNKSTKINRYHEALLFVFALFTVALASQTIIPKFEFGITGLNIVKNGIQKTNLIPFMVIYETYNEVFINGYINYFIINFLGNILMFVPIGFFTPLLWDISNRKVILIGFCSSVFIEACQLFLTRGTDIDDLILNITGTFLGLAFYKLLYNRFTNFIIKFR